MKRVETTNINGIVFSIDDDAFVKLGSYLDVLGNNFEKEQGGREIIADIEARISELFTERDGGVSRVVTIEDVTKVIQTLGTPEDIAGTDADKTSDSDFNEKPQPKRKPRRLYRDTDQRYLGGVCSGIAAWLGISPIILRLAFIICLCFGGASIPVYILLWIIIPKAKTTAQKLEMRGEPVNISNIEKNIKESFSDPSLKHSFRNFLNEAGELCGKIFGIFGRLIGILLGLCMFCWGVSCVIGLISLYLMQDIIFNRTVEWDFLSFNELFRHIISPESYFILLTCAIMAAALVIFALLFWGVKLMSGFKLRHTLLHVTLFLLLIAAIVTGIVTCIAQVRNFAWSNDTIVETRQVALSDTLYLSMLPSKLQISNNPMDVYFDKDNRCFYGKPSLNIQKSEDGQIKLKLCRKSRGESKRAAYLYAENIEYSVNVRDSFLNFAPYFTVTPQDKWKFQTLSMTLYVPEGTIIINDDNLCNSRIYRMFHYLRISDCIWIMTEKNGLQSTKIKEKLQ